MTTKKALLKRFKTTRSGKVLRRVGGQNHYRAKKSGNLIRKKRKMVVVNKSTAKKLRKLGIL